MSNVEVKPRMAQNRPAQQAGIAPALQHRLQRLQQIAVLAAQVHQADPCADDVCGNRHALEHRVGLAAQQHVVLEGTGLALVGIADHDMLGTGGLAAQRPFQAGHEARAAAPAQVGAFHLAQHRLGATRQRGAQCVPRRVRCAQQHVGAPDVVLHLEPGGRPLLHGHALANQLGHLRHARCVEPGHDLMVVDKQRRPLVAQAGAGSGVHADPPVATQAPRRHAETPAQVGHQGLAAQQAVGDVVAEQHPVGADRLGVKEAVETGHTLDMRQRQSEPGGNLAEGVPRQPALLRLKLTQDLHQRLRRIAMPRQQGHHVRGTADQGLRVDLHHVNR